MGEPLKTGEGYNVVLGAPGKSFDFGSVMGIMAATEGVHQIKIFNSGTGFDDFNMAWCFGLNMAESKDCTHFAMLHADISPCRGWLDILIFELERTESDIVSVISPIKDHRGLTSSGIGDPSDRWSPLRRFTMHELMDMPPTFDAAEAGYPGGILLHNSGCFVVDLRKPVFFQTDGSGWLLPSFQFPTGIRRGPDGKWLHHRESEDWFFSRQIHDLGAKGCLTRKVPLTHRGPTDYPNSRAWGDNARDYDLEHKWLTVQTSPEPAVA